MKKLFYFKNVETLVDYHKDKIPSKVNKSDYIEIDYKIPDDWSIEKIFDFFNQEDNPLGTTKGQKWLKKVGLHHTSMSVGDVIEVDGIPVVCMPFSWMNSIWG